MIETDASADRVRCAVIGSGFAGSTYAEAIRCAAAAVLRLEAYASRARESVAAIRERRPPSVPPQNGLSALAIVEAAHRSAAEGVWVSVAQVGAV
ncbi:MAG: hypothetical protein ACR2IK_23010 [Chloroflexota bacterium]